MNVAVLGASPNPDRFANKAVRELLKYGHDVVPVNPGHREIEGLPAVGALSELPAESVDTVTVYVQPARSSSMEADFLRLRPRRVIFNPGAENPALEETLQAAGMETVDACTLVMLRTGNF